MNDQQTIDPQIEKYSNFGLAKTTVSRTRINRYLLSKPETPAETHVDAKEHFELC